MPHKSPPFKRRLTDALAVAREQGFAHVTITTPDGAEFKFNVDTIESVLTDDNKANPWDEVLKPKTNGRPARK
jgi:hypothetical protein